MPDIFGYTRNKPTAVFSADKATMNITGAKGNTKMVQGWNITYRQELQEMYEVGSPDLYWVRGHPIGNGTIQRVVGSGDVLLFGTDAYNICSTNGGVDIDIAMAPGVCGGTNQAAASKGVTLKMTGCVVTQFGINVTVQDIKITSEIAWRFAGLEVQDT